MFAGLTEAIVVRLWNKQIGSFSIIFLSLKVNPFEVVKVKLQTDENKFTKVRLLLLYIQVN